MTDVKTCNFLAERLAARHPEDLSPAERSELNAHIASCPACSAKQVDYDVLTASIRHLPDVTPLTETEPEFFWRDTPSSTSTRGNTKNRQLQSVRALPSMSRRAMRVSASGLIAATILIVSLVLLQHSAFNEAARMASSAQLSTVVPAVSNICPMPATGKNISCTASYAGTITGIENATSSPMRLSFRQQQELLNGSCILSLSVPLTAPFAGTIDAKGVLRFSIHVKSLDGVTITFIGTVNQHMKTISGTYMTSKGQGGTWIVHLT